MSEIDSAIKLDAMRRLYKALETVDVVPVVRCRDCKYFREDEFDEYGGFCKINYKTTIHPNWFCADGERKEQNDG